MPADQTNVLDRLDAELNRVDAVADGQSLSLTIGKHGTAMSIHNAQGWLPARHRWRGSVAQALVTLELLPDFAGPDEFWHAFRRRRSLPRSLRWRRKRTP